MSDKLAEIKERLHRNGITVPTGSLYSDVEWLISEVESQQKENADLRAELDRVREELIDIKDGYLLHETGKELSKATERVAELEEKLTASEGRCKAFVKCLRERDGGYHDSDCKIRRPWIGLCNCGHDDVVELLIQYGYQAERGGRDGVQ